MDKPQTSRWVSYLSSKSSWATINQPSHQQVTLLYTCLQIATVYSDTTVGYMVNTSLASQTVTQAEEQSGHMSQVSVAPNGETIA